MTDPLPAPPSAPEGPEISKLIADLEFWLQSTPHDGDGWSLNQMGEIFDSAGGKIFDVSNHVSGQRVRFLSKAVASIPRLLVTLRASALRAATAPQDGWRDISTAPERRKILVSWVNGLGNRRTALAAFWPVHTLDMGDDVPDDAVDIDGRNTEAGWFEESEANDEDYWRLTEPLTHWMPVPAAPQVAQEGQP